MLDVQWEEPPAHALIVQRAGQYRDFAAALRDNPQAWAILPGERKNVDSARNTAANLRNGKMSNFPKGSFECVTHEDKIYVRYIGEPATPPLSDEELAATIRAWGVAQGMDVPSRGRLSQELIAAYHAAMTEAD